MTDFKRGDVVVFIDATGSGDDATVKGKEYTVEHADGIFLDTTCGISCFSTRFELVKAAPDLNDPLDFTNLELRTLAQISKQFDTLSNDVVEKTAALEASVTIKEAFLKSLAGLGVALIAGGLETAPVVPSHPLSGRLFSDLSPAEVKEHMKVGTAVMYIGTASDADDHSLDVVPSQVYRVTEYDPWDDSVYIADACWLFSADHDHEVLFKVV